jgi:hypothetical protein
MRPPDRAKSPDRATASESTRLTLATSILPLFETRFWLWLPLRIAIFLLERFAALRMPSRRSTKTDP